MHCVNQLDRHDCKWVHLKSHYFLLICLDSVYFLIMTRIFNKFITSFPLLDQLETTHQSLERDWSWLFFGLWIFPIHGNSKQNKNENQWIKNFAWTRCDIINCVWSIQVSLENYWYKNMLVWLFTSSNKSQIRKCFTYEKSALLNTLKIAVKYICVFEAWY